MAHPKPGCISTHAPTKGATPLPPSTWDAVIISTHAPTKGATSQPKEKVLIRTNFNPRSHKGSDAAQSEAKAAASISTHAPTKGATGVTRGWLRSYGFQPTLPQRERPIQSTKSISLFEFQPTLPQRERPIQSTKSISLFEFQPTLPQRERPSMGCSFKFAFRISTHAPTKGATVSVHDKSHWRKKFQPTLPQRERHCNYRSSMPRTDFNPRSHKGSDTIRNKPRFFCIHFNPRSHKGSDEARNHPSSGKPPISTHAPTKGATRGASLYAKFVQNFNPRSHKGSDIKLCHGRRTT